MWQKIKKSIGEIGDSIGKINTFDLVAFLTAYVLISISHTVFYQCLAVAAFFLMLGSTRIRYSPLFWIGVAICWVPNLILNWHSNEDHIYLGIYWCAGIGLALWGTRRKIALRRTARVLIGLAMAFAFVWKIAAPQFYDGSLFQFKLLYDYRFSEMVTEPVGGMSLASVEHNRDAYLDLREREIQPAQFDLEIPSRVNLIAYSMTVWTILIEGTIAILFLLPGSRLANRFRDFGLLLFMLTTYFVVPVMGFASIFCAMGVAQVPADRRYTRLAYLGTLGVLAVWYSTRWTLFGVGA